LREKLIYFNRTEQVKGSERKRKMEKYKDQKLEERGRECVWVFVQKYIILKLYILAKKIKIIIIKDSVIFFKRKL